VTPRTLQLEIQRQPNDETCGPTCLHSVYRYFGDAVSLESVIDDVPRLEGGGTLAPFLGLHALGRGYRATLYTYNLRLFDPVWFTDAAVDLKERLLRQTEIKGGGEATAATDAFVRFIEAGGDVRFEELRPALIRRYLQRGLPLMSGLSATYLYESVRERWEGDAAIEDDLRGVPTGHFVVLHGYDPETDSVLVADPFHENPLAGGPSYRVSLMRLVGAILLGVLTYDGNLMVLEPLEDER